MSTLFDAHVHLYPHYDLSTVLLYSLESLSRLSPASAPSPSFVLFLTERASENRFSDLLEIRLPNLKTVLSQNKTTATFTFTLPSGVREIQVVSGRQIVSKENVEVHALGTTERFRDGDTLDDLIEQIRDSNRVPVLPWSPGKWLGPRGLHIKRLVENSKKGQLLLSEPALRPRLFPRSPFFRIAAQKGIYFLAGTDPLPLTREECRVGRYASYSHQPFN